MSEDLDVKIGTKDQSAWEQIKTQANNALEQGAREKLINQAILKLAESKVKEESEKIKSPEYIG